MEQTFRKFCGIFLRGGMLLIFDLLQLLYSMTYDTSISFLTIKEPTVIASATVGKKKLQKALKNLTAMDLL